MLPETNEEYALLVAENIRKSVAEQNFRSNGYTIGITVSIGVKTVYGYEKNLSVDGVIMDADRALYRAKNSGRNRASTNNSTEE